MGAMVAMPDLSDHTQVTLIPPDDPATPLFRSTWTR
jgi:hypothetical protein